MRYCFIFILLLSNYIAAAQKTDSTHGIIVKDIIGSWTAIGTNRHQVEFKFLDKELVLVADENTNYYFIGADSLLTSKNKGILMRWPPSECVVKPIGHSRIEIEYAPYNMTPYKLRYKRPEAGEKSQ